MLTKKKKGQISMEMLIVVGVLVIGGVIFGSIYLSNIQSQSKKGGDVSSIVDDLMGGFGGWNDDKWVPSIPDHCRNEVQDADEEDVDCGGNDCFECFTPGELAINLVLFPEGSTIVDDSFNINVLLTNGTDHSNSEVIIKEIKVENEITRTPTTNCSFNGVNASSFNNLNIPFNGVREMVLSFSCKEDGNYSFAIEAGILGDTTPEYNDTKNVIKEITPATTAVCGDTVCESGETCPTCPECCLNLTPKFSISIISPTEGQAYFNNQNIQLKAEEIGVGATGISCEWYIGKESIPAEKSCDLSYNLAAFKSGEYKVSVYATREKDGYILTSSDNRNIRIYEYDPSATYLSDPGTQFFGKEFNLKVSSLNEQNVIGASNISFSGINCDIDLTRVSTVFSEEVSGSTVYYKLFPTTCNDVSYSGPGILSPVNAIFNGSNYPFYVGYDLALNFGACSVAGSSYGHLNACVLQTSGSSYNEDYWKPSSYGFLKVAVDVSKNESKNNYGELKVYID